MSQPVLKAPPPGSELVVVCMHSTRRNRREAVEAIVESRCVECQAVVILSQSMLGYGAQHSIDLLPACPRCAATLSDDGPEYVMPGTAELLEQHGLADGTPVEDGVAFILEQQSRPRLERMAELERQTVGGQG